MACCSKTKQNPQDFHRQVFDAISYVQTNVNAMGAVYKKQYDARKWEYVDITPTLTEVDKKIVELKKAICVADNNLKKLEPMKPWIRRSMLVLKVGLVVGGAVSFVSNITSSDTKSSSYLSTALFVAGWAISQSTSYCWENLAKKQEEQRLWQEIKDQKSMVDVLESLTHILRNKKEAETKILSGGVLAADEISKLISMLDTIPDEFRAKGLDPDVLLTRLMHVTTRSDTPSSTSKFQEVVLKVLARRKESPVLRGSHSLREVVDSEISDEMGRSQPHVAIDITAEILT